MRFGTDGVRGHANTELTTEFCFSLARAVGRVLGPRTAHRRVVIGGDTRESTPTIEAAVVAGLAAEGLEVLRLGVAPTPMVAFHAAQADALGVMISASHNPFHDNGIKVFGPGGTKLDAETEAEIEAEIDAESRAPHSEVVTTPGTGSVGAVSVLTGARERYLEHLLEFLEGRRLESLSVVIDTANGAASDFAEELFERAGAQVTVVHDQPDGRNINAGCGATDPAVLGAVVVSRSAAVGLALDGDADRLIAVDQAGRVVDGDRIIAICAEDLRGRGRLRNDTVVVTVMTNLGFHEAMGRAGIAVVQTPVGDRSVLEAIDAGSYSLGGEQSGHIIFRDHASTGDGLLTALVLADVLERSTRPLSDLADQAMERLPQVLINVPVAQRIERMDASLTDAIAGIEAQMRGTGRVLVRPSGTEPLVRVMVEARSDTTAERIAEQVADLVRGHLGRPG